MDLSHRVNKLEKVVNAADVSEAKKGLEDTKREVMQLKSKFIEQTEAIKGISAACLDEVEDREARKKNALIFGVPEKSENSKDHDKSFVNSLVKIVSPALVDQPFRCYRVGKVNSKSLGINSPRPLKVVMASVEAAQSFRGQFVERKMASKVPIQLKTLSISIDKTKSQQDRYKQLKSELAERARGGEKDLYIGRRGGRQWILTRTSNLPGRFQEEGGTNDYFKEQGVPPESMKSRVNVTIKHSQFNTS